MFVGLNVKFSDSNAMPDPFSLSEDESASDACIANISPRERKKRLQFGFIQLAISLAILAALLLLGVDKIWRLPLFFLFAAAAVGYFQWRDKT